MAAPWLGERVSLKPASGNVFCLPETKDTIVVFFAEDIAELQDRVLHPDGLRASRVGLPPASGGECGVGVDGCFLRAEIVQ